MWSIEHRSESLKQWRVLHRDRPVYSGDSEWWRDSVRSGVHLDAASWLRQAFVGNTSRAGCVQAALLVADSPSGGAERALAKMDMTIKHVFPNRFPSNTGAPTSPTTSTDLLGNEYPLQIVLIELIFVTGMFDAVM